MNARHHPHIRQSILGRAIGALAAVSAFLAGGTGAYAQTLSFEDRMQAQEAIERVYYEHRLWPKENPGPKPPFETVLGQVQIEARVEEYLKKSAALDAVWQRPIRLEQLQAEMDRMAEHTQDPDMLRELFAALNNDPVLIAECLVRPVLADRLVRNWYAFDGRFHGELKTRVLREVQGLDGVRILKTMSGEYGEYVFLKGDPKAAMAGQSPAERILDGTEWDALIADLTRAFGTGSSRETPDDLPDAPIPSFEVSTGTVSRLQEDENRFWIAGVLENEPTRLKIAYVEWRKTPFQTWWASAKAGSTLHGNTDGSAVSMPSLLAPPCTADTWTPIQPRLPSGRYRHTAVWTGSEMIVWGGTPYTREGGRYDPSTDTWQWTSLVNAPSGRYGHTAVWAGSDMIVWGGSGLGGTVNTGARYNPASDTWTSLPVSGAPSARRNHSAVWTGTQLIIWGGYNYSNLNTGSRYNPVSNLWSGMTTTGAPTARCGHTAVWTSSVMVVWGGANGGTTGGRYNPSSNTWTATNISGAPSARSLHTAVWTGTVMVVWGGSTYSNYFNTGGRYNPVADTWQATTTVNAPVGRAAHTAVWASSQGKMILWGGYWYSGDYQDENTGGMYDPSGDAWEATNLTGAPTARRDHTAVWTDSEMIVWGGQINSQVLNTGGRFGLGTNTWVATASNPEPSARAFHGGVWTGTEMIIWAGDGLFLTNAGARYAPVTDSWTTTSMVGTPAARYVVAALWTGTDMLVWGGITSSGWFDDDGGRYNPSLDQWRPTSLINTPGTRADHSFVWTGTEMIIWGGQNGGYINTGARYDPLADVWTATSTVGAPSPRLAHSATWTGTEMIVWGGYGEIDPENTGGRYSPSTDSWIPTTTTGAPSARAGATAVWTGDEMIVWGGDFNTGGRYDPLTDSWTATSVTGAPSSRYNNTAVWTGGTMLIWGSAAFENTGGRYFPGLDQWSATTTTDAPLGRRSHTAVWDGNRMLIWGGFSQNYGYFNDGGIYCECAPGIATQPYPTNGHTACGTPVLTWTASDRTTAYDVYVDGGLVCPDVPVATCTPGSLVTGPHTWTVVSKGGCGSNTSRTWNFTVVSGPPASFANLTPVDGSTDEPLTLVLDWEDTTTIDSYSVYFGTGSPAPLYRTGLKASQLEATGLGLDTLYYWRVDAENDCGATSSAEWSFRTTPIPPWLTVSFTDAQGEDATRYLENTLAYARVVDLNANVDPAAPDTLNVAFSSAFGGDHETAALIETGNDTGEFRRSIALDRHAPPTFDNGVLETQNSIGPPFQYDDLTLEYHYGAETVIDSAQVSGSMVQFIDAYGGDAVRYPVGGPVQIRVRDLYQNDPAMIDTVLIQIRSLTTGDLEPMVLTETGRNTAIFEGSIPSRDNPTPGSDGMLQVQEGETIQSTHADYHSGQPIQDTAIMAASATEFIDAEGNPAAVYLESSRIYVRVFDRNANGDPSNPDMTGVMLSDTLNGDDEDLMLTETGDDTSVFEGSIPMDLGPPTEWDGVLETSEIPGPPMQFDTLQAVHSDMGGESTDIASTIGSRTLFVDESGTEAASYPIGSTVYLRVSDHNRNTPTMVDTVSVQVQSLATADFEPVTLTETGVDTGTFTGSIPSLPGLAVSDGKLQVQVGETIRAEHDDAMELSYSEDTAVITADGVYFIDAAGHSAETYLESTRAYLRVYDLAANGNAGMPDTTEATVTSLYEADAEPLTLTETGDDTGVFEGSIAMLFGAGASDGILQTGNSGAPDWLFDTLTAAYGALTDTARTAGSTTTLLHADGRDAAAYAIGWPVGVRVEDHAIGSPATIDTATVTLRTLASLDQEVLVLTETGPATGVFEGAISSRIAAPTPGDGTLQAMPTETLRAWHLNAHSPTESSDTAFMQRSLVEFIDAAGLSTETFVESTRVFVRICDAWGNGDPEMAEVISAELYSTIAVDHEYFDLTETGTDSGIFEGSLPLALAAGNTNNGVLETMESAPPNFAFDTLRAYYWDDISEMDEDFASTVGSQTLFIDDLGLNAESYPIGAVVRMRVLDGNRNSNPAVLDTAQAQVLALGSGDSEWVTLTETGPDTDLFTGTLPTKKNDTATAGDGTLQAQAGETIGAVHQDFLTWSQSEDTALITASSVGFIGADGAPAEVYLESTRAYVRVFDAAANMNSGMPDATTASLSSLYGLDAEPVMLTETGDNTNVFEGSIALEFGPASPADGILQTGNSGSPAWLFDTLTAMHDTAVDTARTKGSLTTFIDAAGQETAIFVLGGLVGIRVEDHNADDPADIDSVLVAVRSTGTMDEEALWLLETGPATGVFDGSLPSSYDTPSSGDGILQSDGWETITAEHGDLHGTTSSSDTAVFVIGSIAFIDASGAPAEAFLESSRAYLRVFSPGANWDSGSPQFVDIRLLSLITGDDEYIELGETGDDTGVFEGSIRLDLGAAMGNGILETGENPPAAFSFDTLTAIFYMDVWGTATDTAVTLGSRTWFMDEFGRIAESYPVGSVVHVRVLDFNFNDPLTVNTVQVRVRSMETGDDETIILTESGVDTAEFTGALPTLDSGTPSMGDGTLQAQAGETVRAEHRDFLDWSQSEDQAVITPFSVDFIDGAGVPAGEYLENTRAYVRVFDRAANGNAAAPDTTMAWVSSLHGADDETLELTETGADTNIFEGSIALKLGTASLGDGTLQTGQSGPPLWAFDTLTATYGPLPNRASDTAVTRGSRTTFIDARGDGTDVFAAGGVVRVRLESHTDNDPAMMDMVPLTVSSLATMDAETFSLAETGMDTGVFEGALPSATGPPSVSDGTLQAQAGETIQAKHEYAAYPTMNSTDTALMVGSIVEFVDAAGAPGETYLEASRAYVRLTYPLGNWDPDAQESAWVDLESLIAGDAEGIILMETGNNTGIFEGSIPMALGPGTQWNSTLETDETPPLLFDFDTLTVTHANPGGGATDTARTIGSRTEFTDDAGLSMEAYDTGQTVYVSVRDHNANTDPLAAQTALVTVTAPVSGDQETVICTETGPDTALFRGSIPSQTAASATEDGVLTVQAGETIIAEHDDVSGWSSSVDTALIAPVLQLMVYKSGTDDLFLDWNDAPSGFEILRSTSPDMALPLVRETGASQYTDPGLLDDGVNYYYHVRMQAP